jgi:hypothetical protein
LNIDELSAFTLELVYDRSLGRDIDSAIRIKNLLRCPTSDSSQTNIDHFLTPAIYSFLNRRLTLENRTSTGRGHSNHERNRNQAVFAHRICLLQGLVSTGDHGGSERQRVGTATVPKSREFSFNQLI